MSASSCRDCNKPIIWFKKDGSDKWNPPLDAESARSGYCVVVDGKGKQSVTFTYMYSKHTCTLEDIKVWDKLKVRVSERMSARKEAEKTVQVATQATLERQILDYVEKMDRLSDGEKHLMGFGDVSDGMASETYTVKAEETMTVVESVTKVHPHQLGKPEFAKYPSMSSLEEYPEHLDYIFGNYEDVIDFACDACMAVAGDLCVNQSAHNLVKKIADRIVCVRPHDLRIDASKGL